MHRSELNDLINLNPYNEHREIEAQLEEILLIHLDDNKSKKDLVEIYEKECVEKKDFTSTPLSFRDEQNSTTVQDMEYAFWAHEYLSTEIFKGEPKRCEGFRFRKTILTEKIDIGPDEV
ncbi:hypothetical protein S245_005458 [Arachis hypogaea]